MSVSGAQFQDPIANLIPTYGEDLLPGYSELAPVMSGIDMLRMAVPGTPGEDYPIYSEVPVTGFNCQGRTEGGYYADPEADCQPFHICTADGKGGLSKYSFLCPNGTLFNQEFFVCEYWFNVDCSKSESFYNLNDEIGETQAGAASSPVGGYASPPVQSVPPPRPAPSRPAPAPAAPRPTPAPYSPPDYDESGFQSSPEAYEGPEDGSQSSPAGYDAPVSSYQPAVDSYGSPSAAVSQYDQGNPGRGKSGGQRKNPRPSSPRQPIQKPAGNVRNQVQTSKGRGSYSAPSSPAAFPLTEYGAPPPLAPLNDNFLPSVSSPSESYGVASPSAAAPSSSYSPAANPTPSNNNYGSPDEYDYEEEPLPTYNRGNSYNAPDSSAAGSSESRYSAPGVAPAASAYSEQEEDEPLPTYNYRESNNEPSYTAPAPSVPLAKRPISSPARASGSRQNNFNPRGKGSSNVGAPVEESYGAPPAESYGAPADESYGAPAEESYGAPADQSYGAPPPAAADESYGAPPPALAAESYGAPQAAESYGAPPPALAAESYGVPPAAPAAESYGAPAAPAVESYGAPAAPAVESYGAPAADPVSTVPGGYQDPAADLLPEYFKSEINLGLSDPDDIPRIEPFLSDYGAPSAPTKTVYKPAQSTPDLSYGVPAAPVIESSGYGR